MKLEGNTVLITGGSAGIGLELAKQLLARGNTVIVTGRDRARLDRAKQEAPALHVVQSDVGRIEDVEAIHAKIVQEFPALNVLVNNAGIMRAINLHEFSGSLDDLTRELDINLKGPIWMCQKFLAHLKTKPNAAIVTVTSGLAYVPLPTSPIYCAAKAALHSYLLSLRAQLKQTNVKVFEIAAPATQTELFAGTAGPEDMARVQVMSTADMVGRSLKGLEKDEFEIRPGQSAQLRFMSRLAPDFIHAQLAKPVERMLRKG